MIACVVFVKIVPAVALAFAVLEQKFCGRIVVVSLVIDMIETGRKFQRDVERRRSRAVTRARDALALYKLDADALVKRRIFKKGYWFLVIRAEARLELDAREIADVGVVDADIVDAVDRAVAAAVEQIEVLLVIDRLDVLLEELRCRDALAVRLADDCARRCGRCRQVPAVGLGLLVVIPIDIVNRLWEYRIDDLTAQKHDSAAREKCADVSRAKGCAEPLPQSTRDITRVDGKRNHRNEAEHAHDALACDMRDDDDLRAVKWRRLARMLDEVAVNVDITAFRLDVRGDFAARVADLLNLAPRRLKWICNPYNLYQCHPPPGL